MSIGSYTFEDCTNLEKVTLPTKVETMGYAVFSGCKKVTAIEIPKSLASNSASFSGCPNLTTITWEEGRKTIQNELLSGCTGLESIEIPASVTSIGNYAFSGCSSLQGIEFPEGLTSIGNYAFRGCSGLTEVSFPESVTSIGSYAFEDCTNLTKAAIPNSIKSIGTRAFYRCPDIVVYCAANSYACTYAMDNNLAVVLTDGTFETSNGVLNYDATYFETNYSAANVHNGYIPFSLNYAIKSNSFVSLSNMYVVVKLPSTAQLVTQTLTIDGEICTDYTENDGVITIPVTKRAGKIRFSVRPTDSSIMRSYAKFNYKKNGVSDSEVIGVIVDEIPVLSIEANSITDKKEINFKGVTTSNEEIKIYLDNRLVTTTSGNKSGSYQGTATIQSPKNGKVYTLKAVTVNDSGEEAIAITNVQYKEKVPTLASFQMIYRDSVYDLLEDGTQPRITFVPGNKFTFKIKFNNTENVDKVFVTSDRNNIRQKMKAVWDEKNGQYIASGFFEGTNSSYVPGELNVFYTTKVKPVELTIDDSWLISEEDIPEHWKNAKVEVQTQTEKQEKISIQLKNDIMISCEYEKLTVEEATEKLLGTTTESQQQSRSKLAAKAADASTLYKGLAKAGWKVFSGTVTAAVRKTDTNWELLLLNESGEYMEHFVLDFGKDKITKAYLSDLVGDVLSPKDIDQVYSFISTGVTAGVSWADQTININAARNEINHSNRTDAQKEYLNKTLDSYEEQAAIIALGRLIGTACQTAGVYTFMANPLAGGILIGAGMVFNDLILEIAEADLEDSIGYLRGNTTGRRMTMVWAIDPSGYVYEGVTGNRLKNVKATAYYKETEKSNPVIWDAAEYDQMNPLYTAADGTYAWDVPEGLWRVKYEKEGYETTYSEWMPVPPPQTEVNIGMTAVAKPAVKNFAVYDDYAQITFSQYMNPDTMSAITLKDPDGKDVSYSLEYDETEKNLDGKVLAKTFKLKFGMFYGVDKNGEYKLTIGNSLENYAGKKMEACTISKKYEKERMLVTPEKVTVPYGGTVEIPV